MKWIPFHHPDISLPVVRRRAGAELLEMLELASLFLTRGGWGLLNRSCYPNNTAYRNATSRLRRQGLVVRRDGVKTPQLILSEDGRTKLPDYFSPEQRWNKKWNKIWYMMVYDVPEVDRKYRNVLRDFLKRRLVGCLQQSVWITPHDIRPEFDDLSQAASVSAFAYLFEARTVLGLPDRRVVEDAWNFDRLYDVQARYCEVMEGNIEMLRAGGFSVEELGALMRLALDAYHSAMIDDPLLPKCLHPKAYLGPRVYALHQQLFHELNRQL